jgi:TonB family protein
MFLRKLFLHSVLLGIAVGAIANESAAAPMDKPARSDFSNCLPEWPKAALRSEATGTLTLMLLITTKGQVADGAIIQSSGHELLDRAAIDSIKKCKFSPHNKDGKPARAWTRMQYVWALDDASITEEFVDEMEKNRQQSVNGDVDALYRLASNYMRLNKAELHAADMSTIFALADHSSTAFGAIADRTESP